MDDTFVRDALHSHVQTDEPPLGLTSAGLVKAGRRSRYTRAAVGSGLALALVGGGLAAVLALRPAAEPTLPPVGVTDCAIAGAVSRPDGPDWELRKYYANEVTCYLKDTVPGQLARDALVTGARPLEAVGGYLPVIATAEVSDADGRGQLTFTLGPLRDDWAGDCAASEYCTAYTGPGGEKVYVNDVVQPGGVRIRWVSVDFGRTSASAQAMNTASIDPNSPVTRPEPPLTIEQLTSLAIAMAHIGA